jgi:hypothetical protein
MPRDQAVLEWVAQMGTVDLRQVGVCLLRFDGDPQATITLARVRQVVSRWVHLGYADTRRILADRAALVWVTQSGCRFLGHDYLQRPEPSLTTIRHTLVAADARLYFEKGLGSRLVTWVSDRELRSTARNLGLSGHIPDGIAELSTGSRTAVEVELSVKSAERLSHILHDLTSGYDHVVYVASPQAQIAVTRVAAQLDSERRRKLNVVLVDQCLPDTRRVLGR